MKLESSPGFLKNPRFRFWTGFWGVGGDDNDSVAPTTPNSITTRAGLLGIYRTFVMSTISY